MEVVGGPDGLEVAQEGRSGDGTGVVVSARSSTCTVDAQAHAAGEVVGVTGEDGAG